MATYKSFEDLPVRQSSRKLTVQVYRTTSKGKLKDDYGLKNQIQRSAVSVSSNIAEGFERGSKQESIQFLYVAKGSAGELRSQLFIAKDIGYMDNNDFKVLLPRGIPFGINSATNVSKQISGFIEYLKTAEFRGQKFKIQ